MWKVRIAVPKTAVAGEVLTVKTLITHPMETGFRRDTSGQRIPRNILSLFECTLDEQPLFRATFHPAIAANPYLSFRLVAERSGTLTFRWEDQQGKEAKATHYLEVTR
ncbi:MAG: thiosulfate oxidation carrier complex protein SoxZ [Pseudomonadota bacterium]